MTRSGDSVIVQADLVSVETGSEIWGRRYQSSLAGLQDLEAEIALDVADKLKVQLVGNERRRLTKHHTNDGEADQLYMNGLYFLNRFWSSSTRMNEDLGQSRDCFHKALKRDPDFALAHLALADIHDVEASLRLVSTEEAYTAARAECRRALSIDQNLGRAHLMLAIAAQHQDWNYVLADREFKMAIELAPTIGHEPYGFYLLQIGRQKEGLEEARLALQVNPLCHGTQESVAQIFWAARRYDEALALARTAADGAPSFVAGEALEGKGQYAAAAKEFSGLPPSPAIRGHLAHAYALTGRVTEAKRILRELEDSALSNSTGSYEAAFIYAALKQNDRAFEWLDKAFEQRDTGLMYLKIDPCFDVLRGDSRFQKLLRRVGLPL